MIKRLEMMNLYKYKSNTSAPVSGVRSLFLNLSYKIMPGHSAGEVEEVVEPGVVEEEVVLVDDIEEEDVGEVVVEEEFVVEPGEVEEEFVVEPVVEDFEEEQD